MEIDDLLVPRSGIESFAAVGFGRVKFGGHELRTVVQG
jgi:hypothetical protein